MERFIDAIDGATTQYDLDTIVDRIFAAANVERDKSLTYAEHTERVEGTLADILRQAEDKWWELTD